MGSSTNEEHPRSPKAEEDTNVNGTASPGAQPTTDAEVQEEAAKDHDDGGEVVEGAEDTVIY